MVRAQLAALKQSFSRETALSSTRDINERLLAQKHDSACVGQSVIPYVVCDDKRVTVVCAQLPAAVLVYQMSPLQPSLCW